MLLILIAAKGANANESTSKNFGAIGELNLITPPEAGDDSYVVSYTRAGWGPLTVNDSPGSNPPYSPFPWFSGVAIITYPQYGTIPGGDWESGAYRSNDPSRVGFDYFQYQLQPSQYWPFSNVATVYLFYVGDDDQNAGDSCPVVGMPVNVTNGNMWLRQTDYELTGVGPRINISRFYNSMTDRPGLFGRGWSTEYDMSLWIYGDNMIRLNLPDNRAIYFGRINTSQPFINSGNQGYYGQVTKDADGNYTLANEDGSVDRFSSTGNLLGLRDRNGNQTTLSYDPNDNLTAVTDVFGRTLTLTPNANGTVQQISDSFGTIATYEYDSTVPDLLKTVIYPDGSKYKFDYTTINNRKYLTTVKDALDNVLEAHDYDTSGRAITSEKQGSIERYTFDYSSTSYTSVKHRQTSGGPEIESKYFIDRTKGRNLVTKVEGVCGCGSSGTEVTTYLYNSQLDLIRKTDALGHETNYTYDPSANVTSITDALGIQRFTYNAFDEVLTYRDRVDSPNNVDTVINTYSINGNLLTSTVRNVLADNSVRNETRAFTYTSLGQLQTIKDPLNHATALGYDSRGRAITLTDANNEVTTFGYDSRDRITSVTNALNQTTSYEYDSRNRAKKVSYPDTNFVTYAYDLAGRRISKVDARNHTTAYTYDPAYRLTGITDQLNHTVSFGYDQMSNLTSFTDAASNSTNYEYDDFNRVKKIIYPPAIQGATRLEENLTYDQMGKLKTRVDTAGRMTSYDYDTSSRLTKITDALKNGTNFGYNARSQLTEVTDALNQQYVFTFDVPGHLLTQTRAGSTMNFEYDSAGNPTKRTDHIGRVTSYEYDVLNRLKKINYLNTNVPPGTPIHDTSLKSVTYTYDELSRLLTAANQAGTVTFTYDNRNRLKTETDVYGHVMEYEYDANNNRNLLKLDGTNYAIYAYDNGNRLTDITNVADSATISFEYDSANRLTSRTYPNGVNTSYEYDGVSRLSRLKDIGPSGTLFDRQYSYDTADQISQITEPTGTRWFGHDNLDRLTSMTITSGSNESYSFDAVGNRTASYRSTTYRYQGFNQLTATQTASYGFDPNGNTVSKVEASKRWSYLWDYENRLTKAWDRKTTVRYVYDALGRRVAQFDGVKGRTKFTYEGQDVLLDNGDGALTKYINGPGIDNKLRQTTGSGASYFLADHLGSTNGLTDAFGDLIASNSYDSFGNPTNASFPTRYQFTGREFDSTTALQFSRARWYDPTVGRFISEDPIGFAGSDVNLYGYVRSKPSIFRDSRGLYPGEDILSNPNTVRDLGTALQGVGGGLSAAGGAIASSPVAVAFGGLAVGVGIGLPIGIYTANLPSNPFVNGPLNPFPIWDKLWEPTPYPAFPPSIPKTNEGPSCQPIPRPIPWTKSPSIPWPVEPPDGERDKCDIQYEADSSVCRYLPKADSKARCWASASERLAACIKKSPYIPPLTY